MSNQSEAEKTAPEHDYAISLLCDGKPIPLVPYVEKLFSATLLAMTGTLKGTENAKTITISITRTI